MYSGEHWAAFALMATPIIAPLGVLLAVTLGRDDTGFDEPEPDEPQPGEAEPDEAGPDEAEPDEASSVERSDQPE